jgi:hypothetical protein
MNEFKEQLKRQVKFLKNSCQAFDQGEWEEAIRIATSIRVLLHDSTRSTSILKHLNAKNINLFSTCVNPVENNNTSNMQCFCGFAMGIIILGPQPSYGPDLSDFSPNSSVLLPFDKWWEQIVWPLSPEYQLTRRFLILTAANKNGGAHVDEQLPEEYKKLANETFGAITAKSKGKIYYEQNVVNMHLVSIRTIANELLKSPDFIDLLN